MARNAKEASSMTAGIANAAATCPASAPARATPARPWGGARATALVVVTEALAAGRRPRRGGKWSTCMVLLMLCPPLNAGGWVTVVLAAASRFRHRAHAGRVP